MTSDDKKLVVGLQYSVAGILLMLAVSVVIAAWTLWDGSLGWRLLASVLFFVLFISALLLFCSAGRENDFGVRKRTEED